MRLCVRKINISNYNLLCGESEKIYFSRYVREGKRKKSKGQKGKKANNSPHRKDGEEGTAKATATRKPTLLFEPPAE